MKSREIVEKEFDKLFPFANAGRQCCMEPTEPHDVSFKDFISSIRQQDIESLEAWINEKTRLFHLATGGTKHSSLFAKGVIGGLNDLLAHLKEVKSKI